MREAAICIAEKSTVGCARTFLQGIHVNSLEMVVNIINFCKLLLCCRIVNYSCSRSMQLYIGLAILINLIVSM